MTKTSSELPYVSRLEAERDDHMAKHQAAVVHLEAEIKRCQQRLRELQQEVAKAIGDAAIAASGFENWRSLHDERMACSAFIADSEPVLGVLRAHLDTRDFEQRARVAKADYERWKSLEERIQGKLEQAKDSDVGTGHIVRYVSELRRVAGRLEEIDRAEAFLRDVGWSDAETAA